MASAKPKKKNPRLASGRKRVRQDVKINAANTSLRSKYRTAVKNVEKAVIAGDKAKATEAFAKMQAVADTVAAQGDLLEMHFPVHQHLAGTRTMRTAWLAKKCDARGHAGLWIDVVQHGVGIRHREGIARLLRLYEHLLDHAVAHQHGVAPAAFTHPDVRLVHPQAHAGTELAIAIG